MQYLLQSGWHSVTGLTLLIFLLCHVIAHPPYMTVSNVSLIIRKVASSPPPSHDLIMPAHHGDIEHPSIVEDSMKRTTAAQ